MVIRGLYYFFEQWPCCGLLFIQTLACFKPSLCFGVVSVPKTMDRSGDSLRTLMLGLCLEGQAMYPKVSNTDSWSLEIVLKIRRFMWRSKGSLWILRSRLGPRGPCQTMRSFIWDPEVFFLGPGTETGPEGDVGIRRFSSQIRRSWLEPRGFCGCDWTLRFFLRFYA